MSTDEVRNAYRVYQCLICVNRIGIPVELSGFGFAAHIQVEKGKKQ